MPNWSVLKSAISSLIKANNNQEITGPVLQETLTSIVNSIGENAVYAGVATTSTKPGTYDGPVFYIAGELGTYANFDGITVTGGLNLLVNKIGSWKLETVSITTLNEIERNILVGQISVEDMLNINPIEYLRISGNKSFRLLVYTNFGNPVGVAEIFTTNSSDIVTLVFTTHYVLDAEGNLNLQSHNDEKLNIYYRSYDLFGRLGHQDSWSKWKVFQPAEATSKTSGLMSAKDKEKLDNLSSVFKYTEEGGIVPSEGLSTATGKGAISLGALSNANGASSFTEGLMTNANNMSEHASGTANESKCQDGVYSFGSKDNTLFTVGNGLAGIKEHNAFEVREDGSIFIPDTSTEEEYYEKPMLNLQEAINLYVTLYCDNDFSAVYEGFSLEELFISSLNSNIKTCAQLYSLLLTKRAIKIIVGFEDSNRDSGYWPILQPVSVQKVGSNNIYLKCFIEHPSTQDLCIMQIEVTSEDIRIVYIKKLYLS